MKTYINLNCCSTLTPNNIFYLAGQSSIPKSFNLSKETKDSNFTGAKLWSNYLSFYFYNPFEILKIWNGGMSFHGAMFGIIISIGWFSFKNDKSFFDQIIEL